MMAEVDIKRSVGDCTSHVEKRMAAMPIADYSWVMISEDSGIRAEHVADASQIGVVTTDGVVLKEAVRYRRTNHIKARSLLARWIASESNTERSAGKGKGKRGKLAKKSIDCILSYLRVSGPATAKELSSELNDRRYVSSNVAMHIVHDANAGLITGWHAPTPGGPLERIEQ